jgi:hypothetical protein
MSRVTSYQNMPRWFAVFLAVLVALAGVLGLFSGIWLFGLMGAGCIVAAIRFFLERRSGPHDAA